MFQVSPRDYAYRREFYKDLLGQLGLPDQNVNWTPYSINVEYSIVAATPAGIWFDPGNYANGGIPDANINAYAAGNRSILLGDVILKSYISAYGGLAGDSYLYLSSNVPIGGTKSWLIEWRNIAGVDLNIWGKEREFQYQSVCFTYLRLFSTQAWTHRLYALFNGVKITY